MRIGPDVIGDVMWSGAYQIIQGHNKYGPFSDEFLLLSLHMPSPPLSYLILEVEGGDMTQGIHRHNIDTDTDMAWT
jgi:hypothetical protein